MKINWRVFAGAAIIGMVATAQAPAQEADNQGPSFPTTESNDDGAPATVTADGVTATITMVPPSSPESGTLPVLTVEVDGVKVAEATGAETDFDVDTASASIAKMAAANPDPAVYFSSYSGGAHCCNTIIVVEHVGDRWVAVPVGDFDGDGDYLNDLDGDGLAEISTIDNRFLYQFDSYAASAAPLVIYTVKDGAVVDITRDSKFLPAHREWLRQIEEYLEPADRWTSRGFLAGWLAEKIVLGEGAQAWSELTANWDAASDEGEEACTTGGDIEECAKDDLKVLKFPERLRLFLTQNGYTF